MKTCNPFVSLLIGTLLFGAPVQATIMSISYEFTDGSLAPTVSGLPAGVTASDFSIGSFPTTALQSDALRLFGADIPNTGTAASFTDNTVLSFSLTIPSGVTLDLISLTYDYTSSGIERSALWARTYSSIHGTANAVNDTIGRFGKTSNDPASETGFTINLDDPTGNPWRGSNVNAGDFDGLTDQTVTFFMPMIRSSSGVASSDWIQFDNVTLNANAIEIPSAGTLITIR